MEAWRRASTSQQEMAQKAAHSADALMREIIWLQEIDESSSVSDNEIRRLSELLLATRKSTIPYIRLKPE